MTTEELHERIATALGWSVGTVQSFSLRALTDLVRPVDATLAREISEHVAADRHVLSPVTTRRRW